MRMQDLIQNILSLIDKAQEPEPQLQAQVTIVGQPELADPQGQESPLTHTGDDINRWRQIVDLANQDDCSAFENEPNEAYADIEAVTTHAGGGVNGPKHPSDMRVQHPSMYPAHQHGVQ